MKNKCKKIKLIILILVVIMLFSTISSATVTPEETTLEDGAIMALQNSLDYIGSIAIIIVIVICLILMALLIVKWRKKETLEKSLKTAKIDIIIVTIVYTVMLILNIFDIFSIISLVGYLILLILSLINYKKNNILKGVKFEKVYSIIVILNVVLSSIVTCILTSIYITSSITFELIILYLARTFFILFIPTCILFDAIRIEGIVKKEQNLSNNYRIPYIICIVVAIVFLIATSILSIKKYKQSNSILNTFSEDSNYNMNVITNSDEELFNSAATVINNYEMSIQKENELINDLISQLDSIDGENVNSNIISDNSIADNNYSSIINSSEQLNISSNNNNNNNNMQIAINSNNGGKLIGDGNGDGKITMMDLVLLKKYITNKDETQISDVSLLDINGDGNITMVDYAKLKLIIVGL